MLKRQAEARADSVFIAERTGGDWRSLTYADAYETARVIAGNLLQRGLGPDRPVMFLSPNSIDLACIILGCYLSGVPAAPVSPAYALPGSNYERLRYVFRTLDPGMICISSTEQFGSALDSIGAMDVEVVAMDGETTAEVTPFSTLLAALPEGQLFDVMIDETTVAKYLFTSGSTGRPKGVINTHGMLCANQQMIAQRWPFLEREAPVVVDWLPWNHTFGGNKVFHLILRNGGTLYIDQGKPLPGLIETSIRNLEEISPTLYFNVPVGFAQLIPYLERDDGLCRHFFQRLRLIFFAAAAMPQKTWDRMNELAIKGCGHEIPMSSGYGTTETAPVATFADPPMQTTRVVGLPCPGVEIKMTKVGDKTELRVRGPNVAPGYLNDPAQTRSAFDDEGYYITGDAGAFLDPGHPEHGLVFDGRVAEDFKLTTGIWVSVGMLRLKALDAVSPLLQDVVITGEGRDDIGLLAWPNIGACKGALDLTDDAEIHDRIFSSEALRQLLRDRLADYNSVHTGSSMRVQRVLLMHTLPDPDAGEITDKGYINQRAVLDNRRELVELLYGTDHVDGIIVMSEPT